MRMLMRAVFFIVCMAIAVGAAGVLLLIVLLEFAPDLVK